MTPTPPTLKAILLAFSVSLLFWGISYHLVVAIKYMKVSETRPYSFVCQFEGIGCQIQSDRGRKTSYISSWASKPFLISVHWVA